VSEFKVVNPATNQTEREFAAATDAQVEQVLERSARAWQSWRTTAKDERAKVLLRVAELYKERVDDLAALITREMGKPTREAKGEILLVVSIYRYYADQGPALLEDTPLSPRAGGKALVRKEPIGALLGIMPWNYPYYQVARFAAPNLMAGNTIILKHAPQCPESALAMEQGLP
jgi:succinate-semialdehyde dehydrogenase / glutarate-semialdehyde dehydrogenase